jgi:hypothetical protein
VVAASSATSLREGVTACLEAAHGAEEADARAA